MMIVNSGRMLWCCSRDSWTIFFI